jgi:hypothetical protein
LETPGHVVTKDGERTVKKLLEGKPGGNKRRNTRLRWIDDVESNVKKEEEEEVLCR